MVIDLLAATFGCPFATNLLPTATRFSLGRAQVIEFCAHSLRGQDDEAVRKLEEFQRASRSAAGVPVVEQVQ